MAAAGVGYAFMPERSVTHPQVVSKPLVDPEIWREVSLVTVRGRPHSPAVGALVHEAMRNTWRNDRALVAVRFEQGSKRANFRSERGEGGRKASANARAQGSRVFTTPGDGRL